MTDRIAGMLKLAVFVCAFMLIGGCGSSGGGSSSTVEGPFLVIDLTDNTVTHHDTLSDLATNDAYKTTKIVLKQIPAGAFEMGDEVGGHDASELPVHTVTFADPYYIGVFEVTQRQWYEVMGTWPSYFTTAPDTRPVEQVSWNGIQSFMTALNAIIAGGGYRLPSEAEWENACKAGTSTNYSYGDTVDGAYNWYYDNSDTGNGRETHEVGTRLPNPWGLYDMHGNVWEWCEDDWHGDYSGAPIDSSAWIDDPRGGYRVLRGGSWFDLDYGMRCSVRAYDVATSAVDFIGFRVARTSF